MISVTSGMSYREALAASGPRHRQSDWWRWWRHCFDYLLVSSSLASALRQFISTSVCPTSVCHSRMFSHKHSVLTSCRHFEFKRSNVNVLSCRSASTEWEHGTAQSLLQMDVNLEIVGNRFVHLDRILCFYNATVMHYTLLITQSSLT